MITSTRLTWQHRFETTLICQLTVIYRSIRSMKPLVETAGWNYRLKRPVETTDESIDRTTEKTSGKSSLISRFCCRVWRTSKHNFAQRFPLPSWQLLLEIFLFEVLTNIFFWGAADSKYGRGKSFTDQSRHILCQLNHRSLPINSIDETMGQGQLTVFYCWYCRIAACTSKDTFTQRSPLPSW